ncbi:MAG: ACP phosphodiesterase [Brumimicrobium sp.]
MNFLGHLYLSGNHHDIMMANLYGDFVKGTDYTYLPKIVQEGVTLHRKIDDFIDKNPLILQFLNDTLYKELPKVAPIAIDLYMDHLLAKNWKQFHTQSLNNFTKSFFKYALNPLNQVFDEEGSTFTYPNEFILLLQLMDEKSWLLRYKKLEGLNMAATGLSKRISFENNLHTATLVYKKHEIKIKYVFYKFMEEAKVKFLDKKN